MYEDFKQELDALYAETFDFERFCNIDPCGLVYELMSHTDKQMDIEIGALLTAIISWGNRKAIRQAVRRMLQDEMQWAPADFIMNQRYLDSYLTAKNGCVYRTLNRTNFIAICENLRNALTGFDTMEQALKGLTAEQAIARMATWLAPAKVGFPGKGGSACKRICMFLRWMVRTTTPDLGLWKTRTPQDLYAVMDVHVCRQAARVLTRTTASWASCVELTNIFKSWDPVDPLKYDIALMTLADHTANDAQGE